MVFRIRSPLCKIMRNCSHVSKYLIVFGHLDKSRNSIPSLTDLWRFATSSHRVLFEGCYALLIKTGRKRSDAKEDAGLQKRMKNEMLAGRGGGKGWGSFVQSDTDPCCLQPVFPCQIRSTDLIFSSLAVVNLRAWKHSAVVTLAGSFNALSERWQFR